MSLATDILIWVILNFGLVVFVIMLGVGAALIPLLGMSAGALPGFLAEPIANRLWKSAMSASEGAVCHQNETDEYEIQSADSDRGPKNYWSRLNGMPFGISYTRSKEAFRNYAERADPSALVTDGGGTLPGKREVVDVERGGKKTYMRTDQDAGLFVRVGEKLAELKDTDGLDVVNVATDETLKTEAGDSGMETKWKVILWLGMAFFGTLAGVGVFFVL